MVPILLFLMRDNSAHAFFNPGWWLLSTPICVLYPTRSGRLLARRVTQQDCVSLQRVKNRGFLTFSSNLLALDQGGYMNNKQLNYCTLYIISILCFHDCLFQVDLDIGQRAHKITSQGMTLVWLVQAMNGPMTLRLPGIRCAFTLPVALLRNAAR